jgi:hypothetical protein
MTSAYVGHMSQGMDQRGGDVVHGVRRRRGWPSGSMGGVRCNVAGG